MSFSKEFLEPRPLLQAIDAEGGVVLLVDEIDKADFEFESLLLEVLSDFQVSIPELGTLKDGQSHCLPHQQRHPGPVRRVKTSMSAPAYRLPND